ncbi:hypothetical protein APICC_09406 [Apis cerana cerana]|uniref:Uncharacterized protein n=1 Tax=Apis cerana cerana TaxID=94128 RepID=A0A2A3EDS9_APICC|nr:hypothetical protein APICC_09406 [Apis cerana cerana]
MKLCYNYFHYAEGPWMNLRLFVWTSVGLLVVLVGCFMASKSFSTADYLTVQLRATLLEGMKKYFTDISWKRRIDRIQVNMQCCGIDSSDDWHKTYWLQREFLVVDSPDILSLNPRGCLAPMKIMLNGTLHSAAVMIAFLFVLQVTVGVLSRFDFTAARNAVALGDRWSGSPGWLFGRLDFGLARGPNLCQIDRQAFFFTTSLIPHNFSLAREFLDAESTDEEERRYEEVAEEEFRPVYDDEELMELGGDDEDEDRVDGEDDDEDDEDENCEDDDDEEEEREEDD